MTRDEFILVYTRYHFDIYKDNDWEKLKSSTKWLKIATSVTSFRANEFYNYLISIGVFKNDTSDKSCDTCKTKTVCTFRYVDINGCKRQFCSEFEKEN
ncbi:MAG: hypothetical protein WC389_16925 [Lutibacter sp.]